MIYRISALLFVSVMVYSISFIPQYIIRKTPQTEYTCPVTQSYQEKVTANGTISCASKRESYLGAPSIPSKVYVEVGDYVEKDQILAEIDIEQTKRVLKNSLNITQAVHSISKGDLSELSSLMEAYGLSDSGIMQILSQQKPQISMVENLQQAVIPQYITAPMTGVVTQLSLQEGVLSGQASKPAAVISDVSCYQACVEIGEADIDKIKLGNKAVLYGNGFSDKTYEGIVKKIYPSAQNSGSAIGSKATVAVEILIQNPDESLRDGLSVTADILVGEEEQVMSIPYEAIGQDKNNQEYVYVFAKGKAVKKEVSTGAEMTYSTQVQGLSSEDKVILSPNSLEDGSRVLLTQYAPALEDDK